MSRGKPFGGSAKKQDQPQFAILTAQDLAVLLPFLEVQLQGVSDALSCESLSFQERRDLADLRISLSKIVDQWNSQLAFFFDHFGGHQ